MQHKNLITTFAAGAALTSLLALSATAQPPMGRGGQGGQLWEGLAADFDQNQDGQVTLDELGGAEATFSKLDRNADGVVSSDDFSRGRGARKGSIRGAMAGGFVLHAADADQDQIITSAEFDTFLTTVDANSDGNIEREELHAVLAADRDGQRRLGHGRRAQPEGTEPSGRRANPLDRDGDGTLEVSDLRQIFTEVDANGDGEVSGEEMPRFRHRSATRVKSGGGELRGEHGGRGGIGRAGALIAHKADADEDGEVPGAEWQALTAEIDDDGNGEIVEAEWLAAFPGRGHREPSAEHFARVVRLFDGNDNEILETADFDLLFSELDVDDSGTLEAEELPHRRHRRGPRG